MSIPDPRQQFGNFQARPAQAPKPAQLSPTESVGAAAIVGQAHAQVAQSWGDVLQTVDKAMTIAEMQRHETMIAELEKDVAQGEIELQRQQADSGTRWAADEYAKQHQQMIDSSYKNALAKNSFRFIKSDVESYAGKWKDKQVENFTRRVIQPRIIDDVRSDIDTQHAMHSQTSLLKIQQGDVMGALDSVHKAASVFDTPQAAIAIDDPLKRQQAKQGAIKEGYSRVLSQMDPTRALELVRNQINVLKQGGGEGTMFAGMNDSDLVAMHDTLTASAAAVSKLADVQNKQRAVQQLVAFETGIREAVNTAEVELDFSTLTSVELDLKNQISSLTEDAALAGDPAAMETLKKASSLLNHVQSTRMQMVNRQEKKLKADERKAQTEWEKNQKYITETAEVRDSIATGVPINLSSATSKTSAQKYFDKEVAPALRDNPSVLMDFVSSTGYVPQQVSTKVARELLSDDPAMVANAIDTVNQLRAASPHVSKSLPKEIEDALADYERGLAPQEIVNLRNQNLRMSEFQRDQIKEAGDKHYTESFGGTLDKSLPKITSVIEQVTGVNLNVSPEIAAAFEDRYKAEYQRTRDAASAAAVAAKHVTGKLNAVGYGKTDIGGVEVTARGTPEGFYDFVDGEKEDFTNQVRIGLTQTGLSGREPFVPVYQGKDKDGEPLYIIRTLDEFGQQFPVVDEAGVPLLFKYDRNSSPSYIDALRSEAVHQWKQSNNQQELDKLPDWQKPMRGASFNAIR